MCVADLDVGFDGGRWGSDGASPELRWGGGGDYAGVTIKRG